MTLSDATRKRIRYYLDKNDMSIWALFKASGVPRSTLCSFMNGTTELIKLDTLLHVCEGFNISLLEFFSDPIFIDVEQDWKKSF